MRALKHTQMLQNVIIKGPNAMWNHFEWPFTSNIGITFTGKIYHSIWAVEVKGKIVWLGYLLKPLMTYIPKISLTHIYKYITQCKYLLLIYTILKAHVGINWKFNERQHGRFHWVLRGAQGILCWWYSGLKEQ